MPDTSNPTLLLTPGPLTTAARTRAAMGRDWGSRHDDFLALSARVLARLPGLAGVAETHVAVPVQGSGTFAVEAAITTLVPTASTVLVATNGAYGERIHRIAERAGRQARVLRFDEDRPVDPAAIAEALAADRRIGDVALVHGETSSGITNPLGAIASVVAAAGRRLHVDAMSTLGVTPIDGVSTPFASLAASANKGLEGVPGLGFVLAERRHLETTAGQASTISLDLHAQWRGLNDTGQWRFTPPVQVVAALDAALDALDAEGGVTGRAARYEANRAVLVDGMRGLGFETLLDDAIAGAAIVTFRAPPGFEFDRVYAALAADGLVIYPGKLTASPSFRIGCIGQVFPPDMRRVVDAFAAFRPR